MMELASWLVLNTMTGLMDTIELEMNLREAFTIIRGLDHDYGNFAELCFQLYYLVLREMGRYPGALVVHYTVEFEGEDAGLVG